MSIRQLSYTVHGRVQGVSFRAYTAEKANTLSLVGYVANTSQGTVKGEAQGASKSIDEFKHWLRNEGSPSSKIHDAEFEEKDIPQKTFQTFEER